MLPEQIKTIKDFNKDSLKEKGSEFIAIVYPVDSDESAQNYLQSIKKKYYDATHHCFAYRLNSGKSKYSDDGEPKGTAGIRILNAVEHFDLSDVLLVVVRYFGGTKLGVGPLGKAYYNASIDVLGKSKIVSRTLYQLVEIETDFNFINYIHRTINSFSAIISDSDFADKAKFKCLMKPNDLEKINIELTNLTNGRIIISHKNLFKYQ